MSSLSATLHEYLEVKDKKASVNIILPANIRFKFYEKYEDIKLENKFSAIPITMPLFSKMTDAYQSI